MPRAAALRQLRFHGCQLCFESRPLVGRASVALLATHAWLVNTMFIAKPVWIPAARKQLDAASGKFATEVIGILIRRIQAVGQARQPKFNIALGRR